MASVIPGGPAAAAGVQVQDVITAVNGTPVKSDRELLREVARTPVDSQARLTVYRGGGSRTLDLTVARRPDEDPVSRSPAGGSQRELGLRVEDLTPALARRLETDNLAGVVVVDVAPGTSAARAGLRPGDIVRRVGPKSVESVHDFQKAVEQSAGNLALLVDRGGSQLFVVIDG